MDEPSAAGNLLAASLHEAVTAIELCRNAFRVGWTRRSGIYAKLAKETGLSASHISKIIRGKRNASSRTVSLLASAVGISVNRVSFFLSSIKPNVYTCYPKPFDIMREQRQLISQPEISER